VAEDHGVDLNRRLRNRCNRRPQTDPEQDAVTHHCATKEQGRRVHEIARDVPKTSTENPPARRRIKSPIPGHELGKVENSLCTSSMGRGLRSR